MLDKNFKVTKPTKHHKPMPLSAMYAPLKEFQEWRLHHLPWQLVPVPSQPLCEEILPDIQARPPAVQFEAISSLLSLVTVEKRSTSLSLQPPVRQL